MVRGWLACFRSSTSEMRSTSDLIACSRPVAMIEGQMVDVMRTLSSEIRSRSILILLPD